MSFINRQEMLDSVLALGGIVLLGDPVKVGEVHNVDIMRQELAEVDDTINCIKTRSFDFYELGNMSCYFKDVVFTKEYE